LLNLFVAQDNAYRESVLPKATKKRVTVEAASSFGWRQWAGEEGVIIGIDRYGASAPGDVNMQKFGFSAEHVTAAALTLFGREAEAAKEYTEAIV
jgi:transketolase